MKKITPQQAQEIIDIACPTWKANLAIEWGANIVSRLPIGIEDSFYKEMREECTPIQHELFDKIFGKENDIDFSILNDEDVFYLRTGGNHKYLFKGKDPFNKKVKGFVLGGTRPFEDIICNKEDVIELRIATIEEQDLYNQKVDNLKDGDLVWIYDGAWQLRYTTGKVYNGRVECYYDQTKVGDICKWTNWRKAEGISLPE